MIDKMELIKNLLLIVSAFPVEKVLMKSEKLSIIGNESDPNIPTVSNISQDIREIVHSVPGVPLDISEKDTNILVTHTHESESYEGVSQITADGKACIPCGSSHWQTVAGGLSEALRFARDGGVAHPEAIERINASEIELNTFERWDGSPDKVAKLVGEERELMDEMLSEARRMRHILTDIKSIEDLEKAAEEARNDSKNFRAKTFLMQIGQQNPELRKEVEPRLWKKLDEREKNKMEVV